MHPYKAPRTFSFAEAKQTYRHFKRRSHFGKVVITVSPPTSKVTVEIEVRQLSALAVAGFHAVAPDMRGYGQTDAPQEIDRYTVLHAVGDMVGLLDALGIAQAVIAGHDWGATVAWLAAQLRPDRFPAVIALSVPYRARGAVRPTSVMPQTDEAIWYQLYFQEPGVAEAEYDRNVRPVFHAGRIGISGDAPPGTRPFGMVPRRGSPFRWNVEPPPLPAWLSEADIDLCRRIHPHRISRRLQLVPQHRPQLGIARAVRRNVGDGAGTLHRQRARPSHQIPRHGPPHRRHGEIRAAAPPFDDAARLRLPPKAGICGRPT